MRVAVQSLLWEVEPPDLESMLSEVQAARYDGVEMAIHPDRLRKGDLIGLLLKYKLALMGISRGSIHEKIKFVQWFRETLHERFTGMHAQDRTKIDPGSQYPYVYLDEATDLNFTMSHPDITFALHPHTD